MPAKPPHFVQHRKANPIDTIVETFGIMAEYQYEDSDVSDEEFELAKRRFGNALRYLIIHTIEEFGNEEVQVQPDSSAQHNA